MSLKYKLLISFLAISLIPAITIGIVSFNLSSGIIREKEIFEKQQKLSVIREEMWDIWSEKQLLSIQLLLNPHLQRLLNSYPYEDHLTKQKDEFEIQKIMFNYKNVVGTHSISIFGFNGEYYSNNQNPLPLDSYLPSNFNMENLRSGDVFYVGSVIEDDGEYLIPLIRILRRIPENKPTGILVINLRESYLRESYAGYTEQTPGMFAITDKNDQILTHGLRGVIGGNFFSTYSSLDIPPGSDAGSFLYSSDEGSELFIYLLDEKTDWKFFSIIPVREILKDVTYIRNMTIYVAIASILLCFVIAMLFSRRVILPVNTLIRQMEKADYGNIDIHIREEKGDEIGKLQNSFTVMMQRLQDSFRQIVSVQKEKREAELKVLEFQINPHFLYNALSSIIWLSNAGQKQKVISMTEALSNYFRISISKGKEIIPVQDEIQHVKNYLAIESIRYEDEFTVMFQIEEEILQRSTIKIILQPIVENAIYHGVKTRDDNDGIIGIRGQLENGDLLFTVSDNGLNMAEEEIQRLNEFLSNPAKEEPEFGIGLRNVHGRIQLHYGEKYGIRFDRSGGITYVSIRIPGDGEEDNAESRVI